MIDRRLLAGLFILVLAACQSGYQTTQNRQRSSVKPAQKPVQSAPKTDEAGHEQFHQKGMAVQARALVPVRHVRQTVGGFNVEFLVDFHAADCSNDRR